MAEHIERNEASRAELAEHGRRVVAGEVGDRGDGWSASTILAHVAFWDRLMYQRWRTTLRYGRRYPDPIPDGLEDLIYHQLGSHHVAIDPPGTGQLPVDGSDLLTPHPVLHLHPTEFQYRGDADPTAPGGMAEIYRALVADRTRLEQIVDDVLTASETGANILVLTSDPHDLAVLAATAGLHVDIARV